MNQEKINIIEKHTEDNFILPSEGYLYAKVDNNHKIIIQNQVDAWVEELPLIEFEQAYDNNLYEKGYAPEKPIELIQEEMRNLRNRYLEEYVDPIVMNQLRWEDLSEEEKQEIKDYRRYLLDYTEQDNWWTNKPLTFNEWKNK